METYTLQSWGVVITLLVCYLTLIFCEVPQNPDLAGVDELQEEIDDDYHILQSRDDTHAARHNKTKTPDPIVCMSQGQFGIPKKCDKYYICPRPGANSTFGSCFNNKQFHHQKRKCTKITKAQCQETWCQAETDKFPDPYTKENFLSCKKMFPEVEQCPTNKIYDHQQKHCVSGSAVAGLKASSEEDDLDDRSGMSFLKGR